MIKGAFTRTIFQPVKKMGSTWSKEVFTHDVKKIKGTANKNRMKNTMCKQSLRNKKKMTGIAREWWGNLVVSCGILWYAVLWNLVVSCGFLLVVSCGTVYLVFYLWCFMVSYGVFVVSSLVLWCHIMVSCSILWCLICGVLWNLVVSCGVLSVVSCDILWCLVASCGVLFVVPFGIL